jgi:hypothetical protein
MRYKRGDVRSTEHRPFKIRLGLRRGFKPGSPTYGADYAAEVFLEWNRGRATDGFPYLPCDLLAGLRVYAWGTGENAVAGTEPIVVFDGEISSHLDYLSDPEIEAILDDLGAHLATKLEQERVEIVYRSRTWPLVPDE